MELMDFCLLGEGGRIRAALFGTNRATGPGPDHRLARWSRGSALAHGQYYTLGQRGWTTGTETIFDSGRAVLRFLPNPAGRRVHGGRRQPGRGWSPRFG